MVLDHLIVQKINDDDDVGDDVQSILTFGAKALFEDSDSRDITCESLSNYPKLSLILIRYRRRYSEAH